MRVSDLASVKAALFLAGSHGSAARTVLIIDAIIQAKVDEDYSQMLATWFPLLRASLQTLANDTRLKAATYLIDSAEDFMQGDSEGDPMGLLVQARNMLSCDSLNTPLQKAIQAQNNLMKNFGKKSKSKDYAPLLKALHNALSYTLENNDDNME